MKRVALTEEILALNQLLNLEEIGNAPDTNGVPIRIEDRYIDIFNV